VRIVIFTDSFYPELGGIQDSISAMCRGLGGRGHEIRVCAPVAGPRDYVIAGLPRREIELGGNVVVQRLFALPAPSSTGQSRLVLPTGQRWRALVGLRPDIVHSHTFLGAGWEAVRTAQRLRVPLIGTNHWAVGEFADYVPVPASLFHRISVGAVARYYNQCDLVTGPSRCVIEELHASGLRRPRSVVSNPIDTVNFCAVPPAERVRLKNALGFSKATVIYAGRLAVEKRIDVLIQALISLRREFPDVMLVLAGHGTGRHKLESLRHNLGVAPHVKFLGTLDAATLANAYRAADVFATASTSETQCMALLQAMSVGLPAVGARWRALPEYIPEGAGLLADPGKAADFADKLGAVLRKPSLREDMGRRARRFAEGFSLAVVLDRWEEIYTSMAGVSRGYQRNAA
jgi:1,2-diacylglycerol 3-alpha-glucosyltransferase